MRFEHRGISFAYEAESSGTPLVLLHGLGGGRASALELASETPAWRRVALDFRAHGETDPIGPSHDLEFETYADDVRALLDAVGFEAARIVGVSMGAAVALRFALSHSSRVERLALIRPAWLHRPMTENLRPYVEIASLLRAFPPEEAGARFETSPQYLAIRSISAHAAGSLLSQFQRCDAQERAVVLDRLPRATPYAAPRELASISVPVRIIGCDRDPLHPIEFAHTWAELIPGATLELVVSPARDIQAHRQAVRDAVASFLAEDRGTPRRVARAM
jgi:pimeloyl-ACP methyl ester carboxylesterase